MDTKKNVEFATPVTAVQKSTDPSKVLRNDRDDSMVAKVRERHDSRLLANNKVDEFRAILRCGHLQQMKRKLSPSF